MNRSYDVVTIGGGIAGAGLATVLARAGLSVLVLEHEKTYRDLVRGETMPPWGTEELQKLELVDVLQDAGGHICERLVPYDEVFSPSDAEARAIPLHALLPDVPGAFNVGHPQACEALAQAAAQSGATVLRGVAKIEVSVGSEPAVRFEHDGSTANVTARLVVGADGRNSSVRRQIGAALHQTEPRTVAAGLLVKDVPAWPADIETLGTEGDVYLLGFPREGGIARLYLIWDAADRRRFTGSDSKARFLDTYGVDCLPWGDAVAKGTPAGPCATYPMNCSRVDDPRADGVVLIGDAAGWNDPIIGQGLSISMRDVRLVSEALLESSDWSSAAFDGYVEERRERMRRLEISAELTTDLRCTFSPEGARRRREFFDRVPTDPELAGPVMASLVGPERVPPTVFEEENLRRVLAL